MDVSAQSFLNNCISNGNSSIKQICDAILDEVKLLQKEIDDLDAQKQEKINKQKELNLLFKQISGAAQNRINFINIKFESLQDFLQDMIYNICEIIEKCEETSAKSLIDKFSIREQKIIFSSLKWLWDEEIIDRQNTVFIKGKKWGKKPERKVLPNQN